MADIIYTNTSVSGGLRGYGAPQAYFILEQLVDMVCEKIGMDPLEFRLKTARGVGKQRDFEGDPWRLGR